MNEVLIQLVGLLAMLLGVTSVQWKHRSYILLTQVSASIMWVVHFLLLGALSGAAMNAVGGVRSVVFLRKKRPRWLLWCLLAVVVAVGGLTWQGPLSILPTCGMLAGTLALWQQDEQRIRRLLLLASPLWFSYNLLVGSYAGIANELILITSILVALWRYRRSGAMNRVAS